MPRVSAVANVRWVGLSQLGRAAIQFASIFVLSRLLAPADFGLFAIATVVSNFAMLFRDMGTSAAVIQRETVTDAMLDTVFVLNVVCGISICLLIAAASPFTAGIFDTPALRDILPLIALSFPAASIGATQLALLERDNQFRKIAGIEIGSAIVGFLLAVGAALLGAGVYSLVLQALSSTACSTVQLWLASSWRPKLRWHNDELRSLSRFSGNLVAFNVINYFARNSDSILIGRFLDVASLGWYSMANRILMFPLQNVTFVIGRALLPVYSRRQNDPEQIASHYLRVLALISAVTTPVMLGIWALREPLVNVALGPSWAPVAEVLAWFAPMGVFQSLNSTTGTILSARGRTDLLRTLGIVNTVILVGAFIVGLHFGLIGVARGYFFATVITTLNTLRIVLAELRSSLPALGRRIAIPAGCGIAMAVTVALLNEAAAAYLSDVMRLLVLIPFGALVYAIPMLLLPSTLTRELRAAFFP
jgi:O-antigen/teichoic acid export membrane protein